MTKIISKDLRENAFNDKRNKPISKMNFPVASMATTSSEANFLVQPNCEPFNCPICSKSFRIAEGVILRDCLHEFCRKCIIQIIHQNKDFIQVHCPYNKDYKCESLLSEREIKGLVTIDEYNKFIENNQREAIAITCASKPELKQLPNESMKMNVNEDLLESNGIQKVYVMDEMFQCPRCFRMFSTQNSTSIVLKDCGHLICKECIVDDFFKSENIQMKCEYKSKDLSICGSRINKREIELVLHEIGMVEASEPKRKCTKSHDDYPPSKEKLTRNEINFWCGLCSLDCPAGGGVRLHACSHHVCNNCLRDTIKRNSEPEIYCPYSKSYTGCNGVLVDCEIESLTSKEEFRQFKMIAIKKAIEPSELYQLMVMDGFDYIRNSNEFECPVCYVPCNVGEGIKIRDCLHELCLECFANTVVHSEDPSIKCPFTDANLSHCESCFQEREIRAVVSTDIYEKFLERKLKFAEHSIGNTFHCKTVDCVGFGIIEADDDVMICVICGQQNCLKCKAIHKNQTCEDYQDSITGFSKVTERYINDLKSLGDVMNCPKCEALINKTAGCSWLVCTFCKMEICWATKGPRWGPLGRGDINGGCKCKLNGKPCHPKCENCH